MQSNYLAIFLVVVIAQLANGLYFHIAETERKCFIEEIPDETTVLGKKVADEKWENSLCRNGKFDCFFVNIYSQLQGGIA